MRPGDASPGRRSYKQLVVTYRKYLPQQLELIGVYVPLSNFYLRQGAPGDITPLYLEAGGQLLLGQTAFHPQPAYILSQRTFIGNVHSINTFRTYTGASCVDSMGK